MVKFNIFEIKFNEVGPGKGALGMG